VYVVKKENGHCYLFIEIKYAPNVLAIIVVKYVKYYAVNKYAKIAKMIKIDIFFKYFIRIKYINMGNKLCYKIFKNKQKKIFKNKQKKIFKNKQKKIFKNKLSLIQLNNLFIDYKKNKNKRVLVFL
jgi:hypothetical protein